MTRKTLGGTNMIGWLCGMAGLIAALMQPAAGDLANQVAAAAAQRQATLWTAATQLEAECQAMVAEQTSAQEFGRMHAAVVQAYLKCGLEGLDKVAEYCQKALTCPQDVPTRIQLNFDWGQALLRKPAEEASATANRQQGVTRFLQALKVVLANQTATQVQPIPEASSIRQAVVLQNQLVAWRECLIESAPEPYKNVAGGRAELEQLATQILDNPAVVQEILVEFDKQTDR